MVQKPLVDYAEDAGIEGRSVHGLRHSIAVHLLEAGRGIEYVADHLGHKNIQNTKIYAQITNPLREQVFRDLEPHPKPDARLPDPQSLPSAHQACVMGGEPPSASRANPVAAGPISSMRGGP